MTAKGQSYVMTTTVPWSQGDAIERVTDALKQEGFGVLTTIDVQATLKAKLDEDVPAQTILGACNPQLAHQGLQVEPDLGALLPCNVVVRQQDGATVITAMEPLTALGMIDNPALDEVAREAHDRLSRVITSLKPTA